MKGILIYGTREILFEQYQTEPFICKTFIDGCNSEEIKSSYHNEQMKKASGEWYLNELNIILFRPLLFH